MGLRSATRHRPIAGRLQLPGRRSAVPDPNRPGRHSAEAVHARSGLHPTELGVRCVWVGSQPHLRRRGGSVHGFDGFVRQQHWLPRRQLGFGPERSVPGGNSPIVVKLVAFPFVGTKSTKPIGRRPAVSTARRPWPLPAPVAAGPSPPDGDGGCVAGGSARQLASRPSTIPIPRSHARRALRAFGGGE